MNYIRVSLNSELKIKLEDEEDLMNTVAEVYVICMNVT